MILLTDKNVTTSQKIYKKKKALCKIIRDNIGTLSYLHFELKSVDGASLVDCNVPYNKKKNLMNNRSYPREGCHLSITYNPPSVMFSYNGVAKNFKWVD